ncbi:MAG: LamG-like jellyroll fold domain-containing protein [Cytophagales bacterium]|nr:T9SS type A sorting domain-containing protein [Bernardetiaceae bacterium]MDW8211211.1 LamG-like jellyroll fold domain-containing protein [Cytophagales bacterium]
MPADPSFMPIVLNVAANSTLSYNLTSFKSQIETAFDPGGSPAPTDNSGIRIVSTERVAVYYEAAPSLNVDIFSLKGKNALGTKFYVPLIRGVWNLQGLNTQAHAGFIVVATEDNTTVTITPTTSLEGGRTAGVPYTVTLDKGQTYAGTIKGPTSGTGAMNNIPAGTLITSNKAIAVTMFHDSMRTSAGGCYDLAGDQLVPVDLLGTKYVVVRTFLGFDSNNNYTSSNPERVVIMAVEAGTTVTVENTTTTTFTLSSPGNYQVISLSDGQPRTSIQSNKPIYVVHLGGFGCETGAAILPPIECTGSKRVQFVRASNEFLGLILVTKNGFQSHFSLNGNPVDTDIPASSFHPVPGLTDYVAARIDNIPTSTIPSGGIGTVTNTQGLFHLAVIHGGETTGTRYGYFSNFNMVNLGPDINVAFGSNITLDAGPDGISYKWRKVPDPTILATTQQYTISVNSRGTYWVEVDIGGCVYKDTICIGTFEYVWEGNDNDDVYDQDNWSKPCGVNTLPTCNDDIIIPSLALRKGNYWPNFTGIYNMRDIHIYPSGVINIAANATLNICRHFWHEGQINAHNTSTIVFKGNQTSQNYLRNNSTASGEFPNVVLNNTTTPAGTIQDAYLRILDGTNFGNLIVKDGCTFTFQNGYVITEGARELVIKNRHPNAITGFNANRFVAGRLRRYINPTGTYHFPVGLVKTQITNVQNNLPGTLQNMEANDWQTASYSAGIGTTKVLNFNENVGGDPINEFILLPNSVRLLGASPRTVEFWARPRTNTNLYQAGGFFTLGQVQTSNDFGMVVRTDQNRLYVRLGGAADFDFVPTVSMLNTWRHYAITYDTDKVRVYVDGNLVKEEPRILNTTVPGAIPNVNMIARWNNSYFNGQIDEVRIWSVARTQAQINQYRNQLLDRCNLPPGLIAYYDFEEGSDNTVYHKTQTCTNQKIYELARIEFTQPAGVDNLLAYFNEFTTVPSFSGNDCSTIWGCQLLNHGYWTINAYDANNNQLTTSGAYNMTLYNTNYTNFADCDNNSLTPSRTTIVRRSNSSNPWQLPAGSHCIDFLPTQTARGNMTGFSDFGIAQGDGILPAELVEFTARRANWQVIVHWKTASEINFNHFVLEKSYNGEEFFTIAQLPSKGVSGGVYSHVDGEPRRINYYRLKMIDIDGSYQYSKMIAVSLDDWQPALRVYPNPAQASGGFFINESAEKINRVAVYNLLGQVIYEGKPKLHPTLSDAYVEASLSAGTYAVALQLISGETVTLRLTVK